MSLSTNAIPIIWLETVDSTQEEAKRRIASGEITQNCVLVAEEQTGGKGTQGRHWLSPKDKGLYLTLVHFNLSPSKAEAPPPLAGGGWGEGANSFPITPYYTQACALACVKALQDCYDLTPQVKPINDIYYDGKKLGGILVESASQGNTLQYLLTGIGLNFAPFDANDEDANLLFQKDSIQPISLTEIITDSCSLLIPKSALVYSLADNCDTYYQQLIQQGDKPLMTELKDYLISI